MNEEPTLKTVNIATSLRLIRLQLYEMRNTNNMLK